jgi:hypothetical protein
LNENGAILMNDSLGVILIALIDSYRPVQSTTA